MCIRDRGRARRRLHHGPRFEDDRCHRAGGRANGHHRSDARRVSCGLRPGRTRPVIADRRSQESITMAVTVRIPTQLRTLSGGAGELQLEGTTVAEVLAALETAHPGFAERLYDDSGAPVSYTHLT